MMKPQRHAIGVDQINDNNYSRDRNIISVYV